MDILLSICIPTLNRAKFLKCTLESLVHQLDDDIELVIVDGGSEDNTREIVESFQSQHRLIRYCLSRYVDPNSPIKKRPGFDRDCDYAISLAEGKYCWILPDDDLVVPDAVATIRAQLIVGRVLIVPNAQVRDQDVTLILKDRLIQLNEDKYFAVGKADELFHCVGSYLTYAGGVVIRRDYWMAREREQYFGSSFVHMGVIFGRPDDLDAYVIARPLIQIRYGNAEWTPRSFQIWMFDLPKLVWSLPLSDSAKACACHQKPWTNAKTLLMSRGKGEFGMREYVRLRDEAQIRGRDKWLAWIMARIPSWPVNLLLVSYFRTRYGKQSAIYFHFQQSPANPFRTKGPA